MFEVTLFPFLNPIVLRYEQFITITVESGRTYSGEFLGVKGASIFIMWNDMEIGIPLSGIQQVK